MLLMWQSGGRMTRFCGLVIQSSMNKFWWKFSSKGGLGPVLLLAIVVCRWWDTIFAQFDWPYIAVGHRVACRLYSVCGYSLFELTINKSLHTLYLIYWIPSTKIWTHWISLTFQVSTNEISSVLFKSMKSWKKIARNNACWRTEQSKLNSHNSFDSWNTIVHAFSFATTIVLIKNILGMRKTDFPALNLQVSPRTVRDRR